MIAALPVTTTDSEPLENEMLVTTRLSGPVTASDADNWRRGLIAALNSLPAGSQFRICVDFFGLAPADVAAHKAYRGVIPSLLAGYGWRVGYLDLFAEADGLQITATREIRCVKAVHCHQDSYKIDEYQRRFGRPAERFVTDPAEARRWIRLP